MPPGTGPIGIRTIFMKCKLCKRPHRSLRNCVVRIRNADKPVTVKAAKDPVESVTIGNHKRPTLQERLEAYRQSA